MSALLEPFAGPATKTYGTLRHEPAGAVDGYRFGCWRIAAEPHVMMEMKRLLPGHRMQRDGTITVADTPEVSFRVAWMLLMFPLDQPPATRARLEDRTRERVEMRNVVEEILSGGQLPLRDGAFSPAVDLFPHQKTAAALVHKTRRLLLLDETGAMKTGSILAAIADPDVLPALVVAPPHLLRQWMRELGRFFPMLRGHIVTSGKVYDPARRRALRGHDPDVLFISYGKVDGWADHLAGKVRTVVLEEAHEIRHPGTRKHKACARISDAAVQRAGLTATPVFNYGDEIYNLLDVVAPGVLGERDEFRTEWCVPVGNGKHKVRDPKALGTFLRDQGVVLKRTLREVGIDLPGLLPPIPFELDVDGDAVEKHLTADALVLAQTIVDRIGRPFELAQAERQFDMKMRQATGIAKAPQVAALIKMLLADESVGKVAVCGWHREVYAILQRELAEFVPVLYTGTESLPQKEITKARFIGGELLTEVCARHHHRRRELLDLRESKVIMISLRSGSGLDGLQRACHVAVHAELDWSPSPHEQFDGRLDRPGQTTPVLSYRPWCDFGTDPYMLQVLDEKRQQGEGITDPDRAIFEPTDPDPERIRKVAAAYLARHRPRRRPARGDHQPLQLASERTTP